MKNFSLAKAVNNIGVFLLLGGSITYHVQQGLKAKKQQGSVGESFNIAKAVFHHSVIPSAANPFILLSN